MKKSIFLLTFIFATALFAQTTAAQPAQLKVGYVDSETILAQFSEAIKAKSDLEALVTGWRKEEDSLTTELQKLYTDLQKQATDFQKQANTLKPDEQQKIQKELEKGQKILVEKDQKLQQYKEQKFASPNGEVYLSQERLMAPINKKVFQAIEEIAKEEGMQFVLNKAIVLYADAPFDVTFKVLDRLKRGK